MQIILNRVVWHVLLQWGGVKPSVLTLPGHKYVKLMYALQGKKTSCRKDITALPIVSQGFLLLGEQVCFSRFCFFPVSLTEHKKAKDTGGRHSWYTGRGSYPCGVFAEITLGFFHFYNFLTLLLHLLTLYIFVLRVRCGEGSLFADSF